MTTRPTNPGGAIPWQSYTWGQLIQALSKDSQFDATTDILPGTIVDALTNDTTAHRLGPWVVPTLINAWTNSGGAFETAGYLRDPLGFVHLKGLVTGGASGSAAFVLPPGYRPGATTVNNPTAGLGITAEAQINITGNVVLFYSAATPVGLSGINFLAEN